MTIYPRDFGSPEYRHLAQQLIGSFMEFVRQALTTAQETADTVFQDTQIAEGEPNRALVPK